MGLTHELKMILNVQKTRLRDSELLLHVLVSSIPTEMRREYGSLRPGKVTTQVVASFFALDNCCLHAPYSRAIWQGKRREEKLSQTDRQLSRSKTFQSSFVPGYRHGLSYWYRI